MAPIHPQFKDFARQIFDDFAASSIIAGASNLTSGPSEYNDWIKIMDSSNLFPVELWAWSGSFADTGTARHIWLGFEGRSSGIRYIKSLYESSKIAEWPYGQPSPDFRRQISEKLGRVYYFGLYWDQINGERIVKYCRRCVEFIERVMCSTLDLSLDGDIAAIKASGGTDKEQLIKARLGQGRYRAALLAVWGNKCAVTGCTVLQTIRASHAKPWRSCNDEERLSPNNGLPLHATLDALFDSGLIAFTGGGDIVFSSRITSDQLKELKEIGVQDDSRLRGHLNEDQKRYLEAHRETVFRK